MADFLTDFLTDFCISKVPLVGGGSFGVTQSLKPGSHRQIVKDNRPRTGKDQEILSESG